MEDEQDRQSLEWNAERSGYSADLTEGFKNKTSLCLTSAEFGVDEASAQEMGSRTHSSI